MRRRTVALLLALSVASGSAGAQPSPFAPPPPPVPTRPASRRPAPEPTPPPSAAARALEPTSDLRAHFGVDLASRLIRSGDADERLRGLERAAATGTSEGMSLLVHALETSGPARQDSRALLAVARGLAAFTAEADARIALQGIVGSPPNPPRTQRAPGESAVDEPEQAARIELARGTAALALATSSDARAVDALIGIVRGGGAGQPFAAAALAAFPPPQLLPQGTAAAMGPTMIRLAATLGDLRALDGIRTSARATDPGARAAALEAIGDMGDARGLDLARAAWRDTDPEVRSAAARALVALGAPERLRAVEALLADEPTAPAGARLAEREQDDRVVRALAARAAASVDEDQRVAAIAALGRSPLAVAVDALVAFVRDPLLSGDAANAIARSPSARAMPAIVGLLRSLATRRLGARAYLVRAIVRGERDAAAGALVVELAGARDGADRALGAAVLVAMHERPLREALADADARVRRAAAMASLTRVDRETAQVLLEHLANEKDEATEAVLAIGLLRGEATGGLTTLALVDRAESGAPDAPLAAMALARSADESQQAKVDQLLTSRDPVLRAHAALGLGASEAKDAVGRLADAYAYEPDAHVRRALVLAVAARTRDATAPEREATLRLAARLDPDAAVRASALRALAGLPAAPRPRHVGDVAWLRLATAAGGTPRPGQLAMLVRPDGIAVPVVFDDDGYALVPTPPGEARVVLAPRLPRYEASRP